MRRSFSVICNIFRFNANTQKNIWLNIDLALFRKSWLHTVPAEWMSETASSKRQSHASPHALQHICPLFCSRTQKRRRDDSEWRDSTERRQLEKKEPCTAPVPSMSSSCPWLPSSVLDRNGAKSTKISLSRGATFSRARSSFVVML